MANGPRPLADLVAEAARLIQAAEDLGVVLRAAGGVGIALRSPSARRIPLVRDYADIDVVGHKRDRRVIIDFLSREGYTANETFNAMHGARRLYFWDDYNQRQLDVFLDEVAMCHVLDLTDRLLPGESALAPADLFLLKLQVMETNEKDYVDLCALLVDHDFSDDDQGINTTYLEQLLGGDWGLWRTTSMVAERTVNFAKTIEQFAQAAIVAQRLSTYLSIANMAPKTRGWRMRARIGERKRWYELPEEAH